MKEYTLKQILDALEKRIEYLSSLNSEYDWERLMHEGAIDELQDMITEIKNNKKRHN